MENEASCRSLPSKSDFERSLDVKRSVVTGHVKKQGGKRF